MSKEIVSAGETHSSQSLVNTAFYLSCFSSIRHWPQYFFLSILTLFISFSIYADEPGLTPGQFNVDRNGGANYSIPLVVPPGTAGMQPNLSLNYNSRRGNGLLGVGWSLGGLSAITRCSKTTAQEDEIHGVDYSSDDRFCLNGRKLIAISGSYGANGTEYRSEIDTFAKVISYGTAGSGPEKFLVQNKAGQTLEYGYTTNSRIEAQGKSDVRVWAVNKIEDTVGNYLTVSYIEDSTNGTYRPDKIEYTGNDDVSPVLATYASVEFEYNSGTRSDAITRYRGGSLIKTTKRLTNIKTYVGTTLVRDYQLTYDNYGAVGRARITDIQECDGSGQCLPEIMFVSSSNTSDGTIGAPVYSLSNVSNWDAYNIEQGDFNGDGMTDLLASANNNANWHTYVRFAQGDGTFGTPVYAHAGTVNWNAYNIELGDFNGDGMTDLLASVNNNGSWHTYVRFAQGDGTFGTPVYAHAGTVNWNAYNIELGDFNGDGMTDLLASVNNNGSWHTYVRFAQGDGTFGTPVYAHAGTVNWNAYNIELGDFNGDGMTDLLASVNNNGSWHTYVRFAQGDGTFGTPVYAHAGTVNWNAYNIELGDFNGDGMTDLLASVNNNGSWHTYVRFASLPRGTVLLGHRFMHMLEPLTGTPITSSWEISMAMV